jgi:hypothetical protein
MAIITTVLASTSAFAIHGFIASTIPFTLYCDVVKVLLSG